jgi:enoyl-CoA hydratase/carnithine racemase
VGCDTSVGPADVWHPPSVRPGRTGSHAAASRRYRRAMTTDRLLVEREGGIVTVTLNRPHRKNAVPPDMWDELADTFRTIASTRDDRVVVVTGANGDFCSGADLADNDAEADESIDIHMLSVMRRVGPACLAIAELPKPTIAKVSGVAVGAGLNMALACDLVVADRTARFAEIFAKRGLSIDFGGSWFLPRRIGLHRAKELALFADLIDAAEADRLGLVNRVVESDELDEFVAAWAQRLAAGPPIALAQTKRLLDESFETTLAQALEREGSAQTVNSATSDTKEAIAAFVERREPSFRGR